MQSVFGKSYSPKKPGIAPSDRMKSSANLSKYRVETPGLTSFASIPSVLETIRALSRIISISSLVLILIMLKN